MNSLTQHLQTPWPSPKDTTKQFFSLKKVKVKSLSHVQLFVTPRTVACQAPPSMGFSRQEYWSGLPFPSPVDLPDTGIELKSPVLQADSLPSEPPGALLSLKEMEKRSPGGTPSINLSVNSRIQPAGLAGPTPIQQCQQRRRCSLRPSPIYLHPIEHKMTFEITSSGKSVRTQLLMDIEKIEEPQKQGGSLGIKVASTFRCRKSASCPQPGSWGIPCLPVTLRKIFSFFLPLLQTVYTSSRLHLPKGD